MTQKWTKESIATEIVDRHESGESLKYSNVIGTALLSAAVRHFGTWGAAIAYAGLDYDQIRSYRSWSREIILDRIRELHAQGVDLSWCNVCTAVDRPLAAAAIKKMYFGSWGEALKAAGLDYDSIRRYQEWSDDRVLRSVRDYHANGTLLNAKNVAQEDVTLITAARRRFDSWPETLTAAGLDYHEIVRRAVFKRRRNANRNASTQRTKDPHPDEAHGNGR